MAPAGEEGLADGGRGAEDRSLPRTPSRKYGAGGKGCQRRGDGMEENCLLCNQIALHVKNNFNIEGNTFYGCDHCGSFILGQYTKRYLMKNPLTQNQIEAARVVIKKKNERDPDNLSLLGQDELEYLILRAGD